ncbi:unnamed protein product (macronuclear) [Paramecium tetraurelia]|uniref:Uncharacterized protein n=1 Tax=Paramecium tetraurelia TaxID=5888 RepID=A0DM90_PARTE|nr:uncharacterized protein GSPATT00018375001 [Paramecium tetraurelia]CAK84157.1 unnamed protein product [Paramecium tetraurelia]|eukprot:XP_001451554.1 hypothetical protein (macronuclear) [Paramecium tetraurelia strain d4-2]
MSYSNKENIDDTQILMDQEEVLEFVKQLKTMNKQFISQIKQLIREKERVQIVDLGTAKSVAKKVASSYNSKS